MYFYPKWIFPRSLGEIAPDMQSSLITLRLKGVTQDVRRLLRRNSAQSCSTTNVLSAENTEYAVSCAFFKKACLYLKNKNTIQTADLSQLEL
jgi:hypothetical protein